MIAAMVWLASLVAILVLIVLVIEPLVKRRGMRM